MTQYKQITGHLIFNVKMARLLVKTSAIIFEHVGNNYFQVLLGRSHVWIRPAMSEDHGQEYYEYVLLWNDDCLDDSHQPEVFLLQEEIGEYIIQSTRGVYRSA